MSAKAELTSRCYLPNAQNSLVFLTANFPKEAEKPGSYISEWTLTPSTNPSCGAEGNGNFSIDAIFAKDDRCRATITAYTITYTEHCE